jgi:DNA-binding NtrC family response regulator
MARILVLDDMKDSIVLMSRLLQDKGHEVVGFTEEDAALDYARCHSFDLAILDIRLKRMGGIEVLRELKKIDPGCKVIMLTGYPSLETTRAALEAGAIDCYVKPIETRELEEQVETLLGITPYASS